MKKVLCLLTKIINSPLLPHPTPMNHDFDKLESLLSLFEDASTQVPAFLVDWFLEEDVALCKPLSKFDFPPPSIVASQYIQGSWF